MPWPEKQFRAIMANTKDPKKREQYAREQKTHKSADKIHNKPHK
jgi:hypothetical protein